MSKIAAFDLGDQWIGIALSDSSRVIARPYTTITAKELITFIKKLISEQSPEILVVGYPKTMRGTESEQTKKVKAQFEQLREKFPTITWVLWDERLTSSWASKLSKAPTKEEKLKSHARAAAFILDSYLQFLKNQADSSITD